MISLFQITTEESTVYSCDPVYDNTITDNITDGIISVLSGGSEDDIIGIMTQGRFLIRNNQPLTQAYIERVMSEYDVIVSYEGAIRTETGVISRMFEPGAVIARRRELQEFYDHAIDNLGNLEDEWAVTRFLKEWIFQKRFRVKSEAVTQQSPEIWNSGYKKIELLQNYTDVLLNEYISLRKQAGFDDCFASDDPYAGDFGGKTPVWVCWWQGFENAPPLVRACIRSFETNIPENAELVPVTMDNWHEYVTFTDTIIDKFNRQIISYTHLADVLRTELLYRYGGLWIDATYYVSGMIPAAVLSDNLYSTRFDPPLWGGDIMKGRWSTSLLGSQKHDILMQFLMESWWLYWENTDELADYFMFDYLIDAGYRHFEAIKNEIDSVIVSPPSVYELQLKMNQRVTASEKDWIHNAGLFYKINRRETYITKTSHGFDTVYGYIVGELTDGQIAGCTNTVDIPVSGEKELVNAIREVNPSFIYDIDGYFSNCGYVSRGIIDDIMINELKIYLADGEAEDSDEHFGVYDGIRKPDPASPGIAMILAENKYRLMCI